MHALFVQFLHSFYYPKHALYSFLVIFWPPNHQKCVYIFVRVNYIVLNTPVYNVDCEQMFSKVYILSFLDIFLQTFLLVNWILQKNPIFAKELQQTLEEQIFLRFANTFNELMHVSYVTVQLFLGSFDFKPLKQRFHFQKCLTGKG